MFVPLALSLISQVTAIPQVNLLHSASDAPVDVDRTVLGNLKDPNAPLQDGEEHMKVQISRKHAQIAEIALGTPPQKLRCLIDSGSSDLWVPSKRCQSCENSHDFNADASSTFVPEQVNTASGQHPRAVKISYGSGQVVGYSVKDSLKFGSVYLPNQAFIIVEDAALPGGRMWDGICGLGWRGIAQVSPTLYENLQQQGHKALFTIVPTVAAGVFPAIGGQNQAHLVLGDIPQQTYQPGTLVWVPAERFDPTGGRLGSEKTFWIVSGGLRINAPQPIGARFLVDTGTNQVLLVPRQHYQNFIRSLIPGQFFADNCGRDPRAGVICDCSVMQETTLKPLEIHFGGRAFTLPVSKMFVKVHATDQTELCLLTIQPNTMTGGMGSIGDLIGGLLGALLGNGGIGISHLQKVPKEQERDVPPPLPFRLNGTIGLWDNGAADEVVVDEMVIENGKACRRNRILAVHNSLRKPDTRCVSLEGDEGLSDQVPRKLQQSPLGGLLSGILGRLSGGMAPPLSQGGAPYGQGGMPYGQGAQSPYGQPPMDQGQPQQAASLADGEPWMIGGMWLENFVTSFDFDNARLGFAEPPAPARRLDEVFN